MSTISDEFHAHRGLQNQRCVNFNVNFNNFFQSFSTSLSLNVKYLKTKLMWNLCLTLISSYIYLTERNFKLKSRYDIPFVFNDANVSVSFSYLIRECQRVFLRGGKCSCSSSWNASSNLLRGRRRTRSPRRSGGTGGPTAKAVVARKPNGYEEYGADSKFKWDIVPWSLPPVSVSNRVVPTARCNVAFPSAA